MLHAARDIVRHIPVTHGGRLGGSAAGAGEEAHLLDFSSNITPTGTHPAIMRAVRRGITTIHEYPDPHSDILLEELSRYTNLPRTNLIVGNGAIEIIYNFALVSSGNRTCSALIQAPTFQEYRVASRIDGFRVATFESMDIAADLDRFVSEIPKEGTVYVCNPNNPTGSLLPKEDVLHIVRAAAARSSTVLVDECFIEMSVGGESVLQQVRNHDNLVVLRSLTKSFGLPGIRIGYAATSPDMINLLYGVKVPWSVNCVAQTAGVAALQHAGEILDAATRIVRTEAAYLQKEISRIDGLECHGTSANFMLVRTRQDSPTLQKMLIDKGILVRDCSNFEGLDAHHIRIAIKQHEENRMLVDALEAVA